MNYCFTNGFKTPHMGGWGDKLSLMRHPALEVFIRSEYNPEAKKATPGT